MTELKWAVVLSVANDGEFILAKFVTKEGAVLRMNRHADLIREESAEDDDFEMTEIEDGYAWTMEDYESEVRVASLEEVSDLDYKPDYFG